MSWRKDQIIKYSYDKYPGLNPIKKPRKETWTSSTGEALKKKIKYHYSIVQDNKCAFCRTPVRHEGYGEPVEHIVPKSKKLKWMFHPYNLCLSCYGCNTKKGFKNTLINDYTAYKDFYISYPLKSTDYKIIHPHFDSYSKHIEDKDLICKPKNASTKGAETIKICELNRLDLIYTRAKLKNKSNKELRNILTLIVSDTSYRKEERESAKAIITNIVERYNYFKNLKAKNP